MRKLIVAAAALAVGMLGFMAPSASSDPLPPGPRNFAITSPGPFVGGCITNVEARILVPAPTVPGIQARPFHLSTGIQAGSLASPCTIPHKEILVSTQLWFLPLLGPGQLVALGGGHGNCEGTTSDPADPPNSDGCRRAQSFQAYTGIPGIYQIRGFVQFVEEDGSRSAVYSWDGDRFLYDIYSVEKI